MKTEIIYILDRSGSMAAVWDDAFNGLNNFVAEQKKEPGECNFTLVAFDDKYEVVTSAKPIADVETYSSNELFPRGFTGLIDAIGKTVNAVGERLAKTTAEERPDKVLVVIMTDGYENASKEFTLQQVKDMIKHQEEKYSWEFIYNGVGIDVIQDGLKMGMKAQNVKVFDYGDYLGANVSSSADVSRYRTGET